MNHFFISLGLAEVAWMYYLGAFIDVVGSYAFSITRSMISQCVEVNELGKVFAVLTAIENLVPIGLSQIYTTIFEVNIRPTETRKNMNLPFAPNLVKGLFGQ